MTIGEIIKLYNRKLDHLDIELVLAYSLKKTREFILTHLDEIITKKQETIIKNNIARRLKAEPIAYITGHKEFYGLDFAVNKYTLIPRPETELLVEETLKLNPENNVIADIGTGSGNIIISLAKNISSKNIYIGIDTSKEVLKIARINSKKHKTDKKINFFHGNLLSPLLKATKLIKLIPQSTDCKLIVVANLPYLSKKIYSSAPIDVKKYEPKSALYSSKAGLAHYKKLLEQLKKIHYTFCAIHSTCILEISPEQKQPLTKLIGDILPSAKFIFMKDLAGRWRVCKINI